MSSARATLSLLGALLGAGALALFGGDLVSSSGAGAARAEPATAGPAGAQPAGAAGDPSSVEPHVHGDGTGEPSVEPPPPSDAPAITWKAPAAWKTAPNSSAMRLATYKIAHAAADADDAELSVVRAGGSVDANIARWRDQFEGAAEETRAAKTVRGFSVTVVELRGTFRGGGMGAAVANRPGWSVLGAIVETPEMPYFFKLTGPAATVRSARADFDALVDSLSAPASASAPKAK